jgi:hypothetical protein
VTALAALIVALGAAACGVPTQSQPDKVDRKDVPFGLTRQETTTSSPSPDLLPGTTAGPRS